MRKTIDKELVRDYLAEVREILTDAKFNGKELTKEDINKLYFEVMHTIQQCSV